MSDEAMSLEQFFLRARAMMGPYDDGIEPRLPEVRDILWVVGVLQEEGALVDSERASNALKRLDAKIAVAIRDLTGVTVKSQAAKLLAIIDKEN